MLGLLYAHLLLSFFPAARIRSPDNGLPASGWLTAFDRWDANWYLGIASSGYRAAMPARQAFFPGYPMAVRLVHLVSFSALGYDGAATFISWSCFIATAVLLYDLVRRRFDDGVATVSVLLFCWSPVSVFYLAPYSEALFALEVAAALWCLDRGRFAAAACVAACATATSPLGVAVAAAVALAALVSRPAATRRLAWRPAAARALAFAAIGSAGVVAYIAYLGAAFGHPLAFVSEQHQWDRVASVPFWAVVANIAWIDRVLHSLYPPAWRPQIAWVWAMDDLMLAIAAGSVAYLVVRALRDRRRRPVLADPSPDPSADAEPGTARDARAPAARLASAPAATVPLEWLVVAGGIVLLVASSSTRFAGVAPSTESDARLVSAAVPLYPGMALALRRRTGPPVAMLVVLAASATVALVCQALFNFGGWMT